MPIAKLPGGIEIVFPEGTSDKTIDRSVQEFLNGKIPEKQDKDSSLIRLTSALFAKISTQVETLREAIYKLPQMIIAEKFDLTKLESSAEFTEKYALTLVQKAAASEKAAAKSADEIKSRLDALIKIVATNGAAPQNAELKKEITAMGQKITDAIERSHINFKKELVSEISEQSKLAREASEAHVARVEKKISQASARLNDTMRAERTLIFDKKTGKPIGAKIKAD